MSQVQYLSSMLAIAEDIIFSLPADVVSKYTFLKQRIKPTGLTVEERELEAALLELLQVAGCPQSSIREPDGGSSSFSAANAVRSCQEHVRQQLQKHETAVKAAEAAVIEESMLSKDALSQAQAEFDKRLSAAMKEASADKKQALKKMQLSMERTHAQAIAAMESRMENEIRRGEQRARHSQDDRVAKETESISSLKRQLEQLQIENDRLHKSFNGTLEARRQEQQSVRSIRQELMSYNSAVRQHIAAPAKAVSHSFRVSSDSGSQSD